jgi:hypothetical protein
VIIESIPFFGRLAISTWNVFSARRREVERERPEVLFKVRHREPHEKWRSVNFSVTNHPAQQLVAKKIELELGPWGSFGARIAPAIVDGDHWRMVPNCAGRSFEIDHILRGTTPRQNVPFFLHDPREIIDNGRDWLRLRILIEHRTDAQRYWWTRFYFPLPQQPGDDILFNRRGPHR